MPALVAPLAHLRLLVVAALVAAATLVGAVAPVQAASTIDLSSAPTSGVVGQPLTVTWTSTDVTDLVASGSWATTGAVEASGSQTVTPTAPGELTFTLTGTGGGQPVTQTITVPVAAAGTVVTATAPTKPGTCFISIPDVTGVLYSIAQGEAGPDDDLPLDPGDYPVVLLPGDTITASAEDGFTLAPGSPTSFAIEVPETCEPQDADVVDVTTGCGTVTFANRLDRDVTVLSAPAGTQFSEELVELSAGSAATLTTKESRFSYVAVDAVGFGPDPDDVDALGPRVESGEVDVRQGCGDHPIVAPAAGR